jgi:hypothetical protein
MALGLYGRWEPQRLFSFMSATHLKAFIDESGTHEPSNLTVLSGFVGYASEWEKFELKWGEILLANRLEYIRGKELWQGTKQFRERPRWNGPNRAVLAGIVAPLAMAYSQFSISVILDNVLYDQHYIGSSGKKPRHALDSKYGVCCRVFMSVLARFLEKYEGEAAQVHLVFEAGHRNCGAPQIILKEMYDIAPEIARFISPQITFALKEKSPGCQAADLLAYPVFKTENAGNIFVENFSGNAFPEIIGPECPHFRVPVSAETLLAIKSGQWASATLKRQKGRYWTALDGFPVGWSARPLRSIEGYVLTPPRGLTAQACPSNYETLLPAHSVQLRCL